MIASVFDPRASSGDAARCGAPIDPRVNQRISFADVLADGSRGLAGAPPRDGEHPAADVSDTVQDHVGGTPIAPPDTVRGPMRGDGPAGTDGAVPGKVEDVPDGANPPGGGNPPIRVDVLERRRFEPPAGRTLTPICDPCPPDGVVRSIDPLPSPGDPSLRSIDPATGASTHLSAAQRTDDRTGATWPSDRVSEMPAVAFGMPLAPPRGGRSEPLAVAMVAPTAGPHAGPHGRGDDPAQHSGAIEPRDGRAIAPVDPTGGSVSDRAAVLLEEDGDRMADARLFNQDGFFGTPSVMSGTTVVVARDGGKTVASSAVLPAVQTPPDATSPPGAAGSVARLDDTAGGRFEPYLDHAVSSTDRRRASPRSASGGGVATTGTQHPPIVREVRPAPARPGMLVARQRPVSAGTPIAVAIHAVAQGLEIAAQVAGLDERARARLADEIAALLSGHGYPPAHVTVVAAPARAATREDR